MNRITLDLEFTPKVIQLLSGLIGENTPANTAQTVPENTEDKPTEEVVTKDELRKYALKLSRAGKQDIVKGIFNRFGTEKLSGVKESDYPLLKQALLNA